MIDIWKSFCYIEVSIVQKSRDYGYGYYSYKVLSLVQWVVLLVQYFPVFPYLSCLQSFKCTK